MKLAARQTLHKIYSVASITSLLLGLLAPSVTQTATAATLDGANTDLFTGQFIPAYLGSAYDPSEAFKQMAGMTVYVFSYDTYGKVVNNFAYKTQIKADGSFQAAGLPNASHYGICLGDQIYKNNGNTPLVNSYDAPTSYFRSPMPQDNLQVSFAYNQQVYPSDDTVDTQAAPPPPQKGQTASTAKDEQISLKGCRTFLTSSRTVDINNHVNIFPLVPNSVLSVIINDSTVGYDAYSSNKPYEIYAQRVVLNNSSDETSQQAFQSCMTTAQSTYDAATQSGDLVTSITALANLVAARVKCQQDQNARDSKNNYTTNGPVIRGRTIAYQGPNGGAATIFQAFAPRGMYAITYWRPDDRNAQTTMTYLNYDGVTPLNTQYNGLAFEQVGYPDKSLWQTLSSRDPSASAGNAWIAQPGSVNIWGVIGAGQNGTTQPQAGAQIDSGDSSLSLVDLTTRTCSHSDTGNYTVGVFGIYFFSNSNGWCQPVPAQGQKVATASQSTSSEIALPSQGSFGGTPPTTVDVTGLEGPARRDLTLTSSPAVTKQGTFLYKGRPLAGANIDLVANGTINSNVAETDSQGRFSIASSYFATRFGDYSLIVRSSFLPSGYKQLKLDSYTLAQLYGRNASFGTVALDVNENPISSFLAKLNLSNALSLIQIPDAWAVSPAGQQQTGYYDKDSNGPFTFVFNYDASLGAAKWAKFTPTNYSIINAHVIDVDDTSCFVFCKNRLITGGKWSPDNTKLLTKHHNSSNQDDAYLTTQDSWDDQTKTLTESPDQNLRNNSPITGVILDFNNLSLTEDGKVFAANDTNWKETIAKNMDPGGSGKKFKLILDYKRNCVVSTSAAGAANQSAPQASPANDQCDNNQDSDELEPPMYHAEWPIVVIKNTDGSYKITYDAVMLSAQDFNCAVASDGSFTGSVTSTVCSASLGLVNFISNNVDTIANQFFVIDPFKHPIVIDFWNIIRNLVNGLCVLILIFAGVAIMFKYEPKTFSIQSVLTRLLITVVLVNFSILIIQAAVDVANVLSLGGYYTMKTALDASSAATGVKANGAASIGAGLGAIAIAVITGAALTGGVGLLGVLLAIFAVFIGLAYLMFRVVLEYFLRLAIIWVCIITAPAAMASRITPGASKFFDKWKNLLVGTLMAQVALAFTLALAVGILRTTLDATSFFNALIQFFLALGMFYLAIKAPNKVAASFGASMTANLEGNIKKAAKASKGQLDKLGKSRAENKARKQVDESDRKIDEESQQKALNKHRNWAARNFVYRPALSMGYGARRQWAAAGRGLEGKIAPSQDDLNKAFDTGLTRAQSEARSRQQHEKPALVQQRIEEAQFNNETDTDKRMGDYLTKISDSNRQASLEMLNVGSTGLPRSTIRFERVRGGARTAAGGFNTRSAAFLAAWNDTPLAQRAPELARAYLTALQATNGGDIDNAAQLRAAISATRYGGLRGSAAFKKGLQDKGMDFVYFGESDAYGLAGAQVVNKVGGKLSPTGEIMESIKTQTGQIKASRPLTP